MEILKTVLIILEALCSLALIVVVLMQSGKEAGLSSTFTGASETYLSKNKKGNLDAVLASATKWIALAWVLAGPFCTPSFRQGAIPPKTYAILYA